RQVRVELAASQLPADFLVIATQNPREFEGTYPLPESQLDRFMLRIDMDYPAREAEADILARYGGVLAAGQEALGQITVLGRALIGEARAEVEKIHVAGALLSYVLDLAHASREHARLTLGLSTRGALALLKAGRIAAAPRAFLGRPHAAAFVFTNASARPLAVEYAPALPAGFEPLAQVRRVSAPAHATVQDCVTLLPVRLGPQVWPALPARVLGVLRL